MGRYIYNETLSHLCNRECISRIIMTILIIRMNGVCGSNLILNFIELRNNILKLVVS